VESEVRGGEQRLQAPLMVSEVHMGVECEGALRESAGGHLQERESAGSCLAIAVPTVSAFAEMS
jgi:hypothetical protein